MSVIPITVFFSLLLAGLFISLFVHEQRRRRFTSVERDSLLPLAEETPRTVTADVPAASLQGQAGHDDGADHDHAHGATCGCRDGLRPPCLGCLKRAVEAPAPSL